MNDVQAGKVHGEDLGRIERLLGLLGKIEGDHDAFLRQPAHGGTPVTRLRHNAGKLAGKGEKTDTDCTMTEQHWDPDRYARNARFVADLGVGVVELLNPQPGERILDLGCGDGALTRKLVDMGCEVVGVDSSAEQIAAACKSGLDARVKDCQALDFDHEFDAVFSNAALHWMKKRGRRARRRQTRATPRRAICRRDGGRRLRASRSAWRWKQALARRGIDGASRNPWYFPPAEEYAAKLQQHGFTIDFISLFDRPTDLPGAVTGLA